MKRSTSGFTFLELLITGVMITVLASFAIPAYQDHVIRKNRALARTTLVELSLQQEAYALQHQAYATGFDVLLGSNHSSRSSFYLSRDRKKSSSLDGNGRSIYKFELADADNSAFTLIAVAVGAQTRDRQCQRLVLSSKGQRSADASQNESSANCWD